MENARALVKVEGNIIEYPFFHLGGKRNKTFIKEYDLGEKTLDDGLEVKRKLIVDNYRYGIPGPYDQDVLMGIMRIGTKKDKLTEDIPFTIYEVAKEIDDLKNWVVVKKSIERLVTTNYRSKQVILIKETNNNYYLDDLFHILDSVTFLDKEMCQNKRKSNEITKVRFNKFFINNFLNDYYKYIDLKKYLALRSPTAKKLYLYLEKKKYKKEMYQIKLDNLACILPLEVNEYYQIRWILKKAHERLIEHSIIESFEFNKDKVIYYFPCKKEKISGENIPVNDIFDELINIGISRVTAEVIVKRHDPQKIKRQIEFLKHRKADNPQGILIKSIMEDWAAPPEYLKEIKKKERIEKQNKKFEDEKRAEEAKKKADELVNNIISGLSCEEMDKYNKKAEDFYRVDNPGLDLKYFKGPYRDLLVKKLIMEDKGLCQV